MALLCSSHVGTVPELVKEKVGAGPGSALEWMHALSTVCHLRGADDGTAHFQAGMSRRTRVSGGTVVMKYCSLQLQIPLWWGNLEESVIRA